jgi:hypothetical protein
MSAPVFCLYPGCGIRLTDPNPALRKTIRPPRARTPPRAAPTSGPGQEDLLTALIEQGDQP